MAHINYPFAIGIVVYTGSFLYLYLRCRAHLPFKKYLSNHALLLAPLNFIFVFFTKGRQAATFDPRLVPGLDKIKANYPLIRSEAKVLLDTGVFQRPPAVDEPSYNTFERGGWRMYPLKWYTKECRDSAKQACPQTCAILDSIPAIRSALFTVLPPDARLGAHHDPLASSLRYHLGLLTPNSDQCALILDGKNYPWHDGEELLFDQTYLHSAANKTDIPRVILFCDVEKVQLLGGVKQLAEAINYMLVSKLTGKNDKGKLSWLSSAYQPIYKIRYFVKKKIKPKSLLAYNVIKFGTIGLFIALLYWLTLK